MHPRGPAETFQPIDTQEYTIRRHGLQPLASDRTNTSDRSSDATSDQPALRYDIDSTRGASLGDLQSAPIYVGSSDQPEAELIDSGLTIPDSVWDEYFQ